MKNQVQILQLESLVADPNQPRQEFDVKALRLLEQSVKAKGILVQLAVEKMANGKFLLVDGERRYRTAKKLGLKEVPAIVYEPMDEVERISARFHLQEQHSNWTAFDKARAISILQKATGMSQAELAEQLGLDARSVQLYVMLLSLSKRTVQFANDKKLNFKIVSKIAFVKKAVLDVKQKTQVEDAIVAKIESGLLQNADDIGGIAASLNFLKNNKSLQAKVIKHLIEDDDYGHIQAAEESKRGDYLTERKIMYYLRTVGTYIKQVMDVKTDYALSPEDVKRIKQTQRLLEEYKDGAKEE